MPEIKVEEKDKPEKPEPKPHVISPAPASIGLRS